MNNEVESVCKKINYVLNLISFRNVSGGMKEITLKHSNKQWVDGYLQGEKKAITYRNTILLGILFQIQLKGCLLAQE